MQLRRRYQYFRSQVDAREKTEFEVINILIKKTLHVSSKQNGARF